MFACLFWTCMFFIGYRNEPKEKRIMFWFMLTATVLYFGHYCYFGKFIDMLPITDTFYSFANLTVFPMYYQYVKQVSTGRSFNRRSLLLFVPAFVILVSNGLAYMLSDADDLQKFIRLFLYHESLRNNTVPLWLVINHKMSVVVFAVLVIYVLYKCFALIRKFDLRLKDFFSDEEKYSMSSVRTLQICLVLASLGAAVLNALSKSFFADSMPVLSVPSVLFTILLFSLGNDAYKRTLTVEVLRKEFAEEHQESVAETPMEEETSEGEEKLLQVDEREEQNDMQDAQQTATHKETTHLRVLADKIVVLLHDERMYQQPDLKITDLASALNTNRQYIYQAISSELNTNFSDLVNTMRIEYAMRLLLQDADISKSDLIVKSGYTSESSFYRNFKKVTGKTPAEWKVENQK